MLDARQLNDQLDVSWRTLQPLADEVAGALEVLVGRQQPRQPDTHLGSVRVSRQLNGENIA